MSSFAILARSQSIAISYRQNIFTTLKIVRVKANQTKIFLSQVYATNRRKPMTQ